jgi:hypothetical protein
MPQYNPMYIQKYLGGMEYPATKAQLIEYAEEQGAPEEVVEALSKYHLEKFETPADLISTSEIS